MPLLTRLATALGLTRPAPVTPAPRDWPRYFAILQTRGYSFRIDGDSMALICTPSRKIGAPIALPSYRFNLRTLPAHSLAQIK